MEKKSDLNKKKSDLNKKNRIFLFLLKQSRFISTLLAPHHSVFYRLDAVPAAQPTASKH